MSPNSFKKHSSVAPINRSNTQSPLGTTVATSYAPVSSSSSALGDLTQGSGINQSALNRLPSSISSQSTENAKPLFVSSALLASTPSTSSSISTISSASTYAVNNSTADTDPNLSSLSLTTPTSTNYKRLSTIDHNSQTYILPDSPINPEPQSKSTISSSGAVTFKTNAFKTSNDTPKPEPDSSNKQEDQRSSPDIWSTFYKFASTSRHSDSILYAVTRKEAYLQSSITEQTPSSRQIIELWTMTALRFILKGRLLFSPEKEGSTRENILDLQGLFRDHWSWQMALDNPSSVVYGFKYKNSLYARNGIMANKREMDTNTHASKSNPQSSTPIDTTSNTAKNTQPLSPKSNPISDPNPIVIEPPLSPKSQPAVDLPDPDAISLSSLRAQLSSVASNSPSQSHLTPDQPFFKAPSSVSGTSSPISQGSGMPTGRRKSVYENQSNSSISPKSSTMSVNILDPITEPPSELDSEKDSVFLSPRSRGSSISQSSGQQAPGSSLFGSYTLSADSPSQSRRPSGQFLFENSRRPSASLIAPISLALGDTQSRRPSTTVDYSRRLSATATAPTSPSPLGLNADSNNDNLASALSNDANARRPSVGRSISTGPLTSSSSGPSRRPSTSSFSNLSSINLPRSNSITNSALSSANPSRRSSIVSVSSPLVNEITPESLEDIQVPNPRPRQGSAVVIPSNLTSFLPSAPSSAGSVEKNPNVESPFKKVRSAKPQPALDQPSSGTAGYPFRILNNEESSIKNLIFPTPQTETTLPTGPANYIPCIGHSITKLPFEDNTFDVISGKSMWCFLRKDEWLPALKELFRVLKPGGYVELIASDFVVLNGSERDNYWWSKLVDSVEAVGIDPFPCAKLPDLLFQAGYEDVTRALITLPRGWGGQVGHLTEFLSLCFSEALFRIYSGLPQEEIDQFRMAMRIPSEKDSYPASQMMLVYAMKPLSPTDENQ